jgi:hypothetical protein
MTIDVSALLRTPDEEIKRPKSLPNGHYFGSVTQYSFDKAKNENRTNFCRINFKLEGPGDDVDGDEVADIDFSRRELRKDFFITPDALYRLRDFVNAVIGEDPTRTLDEKLPDIRGQRVLIQVTSRTDRNDPEIVYNDVGKVVAA